MNISSDQIAMGDIYRFLAQSMRYPDAQWLNENYWSALLNLLDQLQWQQEREELITAKADAKDFLEDLQVEHTRLFINAVPHVIASPYASVHYKGDGTLYGPLTEETKKFYHEKGFGLAIDNDLPDHIVYELEFLAILVKEDPTGEQEFLEKLFTPWFDIFKNKVVNQAHHPFYRIVVNLIDFFTREEL